MDENNKKTSEQVSRWLRVGILILATLGPVINTILEIARKQAEKLQEMKTIQELREHAYGQELLKRSSQVSQALVEQSSKLTQALAERSGQIPQTLIEQSNRLTQALAERSSQIPQALVEQSNRLTQALRSSQVPQTLIEQSNKLTQALAERSSQIPQTLVEQSSKLTQALAERSGQVPQALVEQSSKLTQALAERAGVLVERGSKLSQDLSKRGEAVTREVTKRGRQATQELAQRTEEITERVSERPFVFWLTFGVGLTAAAFFTYQFLRRRFIQHTVEEGQVAPDGHLNGTITLPTSTKNASSAPADSRVLGLVSNKRYYPANTPLEQLRTSATGTLDVIYFASEEEAKAQGFTAAE
jgi:hypothetical protein